MKKALLVLTVIALVAAGVHAGTLPASLIRPHGATQSLSFDDLGLGGGTSNSGTYAPGDTISFDVYLTFSGYNSTGLSFWLEASTALASSLSITGVTYGTAFPDATSTAPNPAPFDTSVGASPGFRAERRDLGSTINDFANVPGPGTYFVAHITLSLSPSFVPGNYIIQSTVTSPRTSEATSFDGTTFADNNIPAAQYFIGIIPEPTTFNLAMVAALAGLGLVARRQRKIGTSPMKKTLLVLTVTALFAAGATAGTLPSALIRPHGTSQSLTFDDLGLGGGDATHGTYGPGSTFGFDVLLTYSGYNSTGLSFWLEASNAFAGSLSITGVTYGTTFPDPTNTAPNPAPFNTSVGASPGFMTETRDLGSTINDFGNVPGPGTYFVAHITFALSPSFVPGNYVIQSTVNSPHTSEATSFDGTTFADNNLPAAQYFIVLIPEPTTFSLIAIVALAGLGFLARKRYFRTLSTP
jgi:opacity protein-like surface antigen